MCQQEFSGVIVRMEKDGFGIIRFADTAQLGFFTNTTPVGITARLKVGATVSGMMDADPSDANAIATVLTITSIH